MVVRLVVLVVLIGIMRVLLLVMMMSIAVWQWSAARCTGQHQDIGVHRRRKIARNRFPLLVQVGFVWKIGVSEDLWLNYFVMFALDAGLEVLDV